MSRSQIDYRSGHSSVQVGSGPRRATRLGAVLLIYAIPWAGPGPSRVDAADVTGGPQPPAGTSQPSTRSESRVALKPSSVPGSVAPRPRGSLDSSAEETPIARALRMISECKARFRAVDDYSCDFYKRERINGKLTELHVMTMKERTQPKSIYFKFQQPNRGREAIYVEGRNGGSVLAHDVGFTKLLAGTLELDPDGARAMENNRHPITEAGIGALIDTVEERWSKELDPKHSIINHVDDLELGPHHSVSMIESIHPTRRPEFLFHKVRLYIEPGMGLPIRFEAYDWPKSPGGTPELLEEYTYLNLKLNVGLRELDFDPANSSYSFGRF